MGYISKIARTVAGAAVAAITALVAPAQAGDYDGNFMIRLQGTAVITQDSLQSLHSTTLGDLKALGFDAEVTDKFIPTATLTYFLNKNLAVELFCCFSKHEVDLKPPAAFAGLAGEVAEAWIFPPIVTLQYHVTGLGAFKPYVGVGFQYIHFFNEKLGGNALNATSVNFSDAFGPALQAGFDLAIGNGWYLNADIKKAFLDTKVTWQNAVGGAGGTIVAKDDLDPLTISVGIGYRFNLFGPRDMEPLK